MVTRLLTPFRRRPRHTDVTLVAIVASMNISGFLLSVVIWRLIAHEIHLPGALYVLVPLFAVVQAVPLYWRRRRPLPVLFTVLGLYVVAELTASWLRGGVEPSVGAGISSVVALYAVGAYAERRAAWVGLVAGVAAVALVEATTIDPSEGPVEIAVGLTLAPALAAALPWVVGRLVRSNRGLAAERETTARRTKDLEAERARRAMAEERGRIARELHDVIAHHVGVMVIQAGAGQRVLDHDPERARAAFHAIQDAGRAALTAMPAVLGALRGDGGPGLAPVPGLRDVDALIEQVESAGMTVTREVSGTPRPLPPDAELAAYRVLQEGLTNVLKHAGPVRATVTVSYEPDRLEVAVRDAGPDGAPPVPVSAATGQGLLGMRERVELLGGTLRSGPLAAGGFEVAVRLPLPPEATAAVGAAPTEARS
jgi:signal transduction histidine kinase